MKTINIKGKEYVTVDERIKFLRENYPDSQILTEIISIDAESIIMKASLIINDKVVAVGHASEDKNSSYINKTSYIENCETSAIGRCLGIYGIGLCGSIASADEVINAINQQQQTQQPQQQTHPQQPPAQQQAQPSQYEAKKAPRKPLNLYPNQNYIEQIVMTFIQNGVSDEAQQLDILHSFNDAGFFGIKSEAQLKFFLAKIALHFKQSTKQKTIDESFPIENFPEFP